MQHHLKQLMAFCHRYPIEAKILIVPSMTVGEDLVMALARGKQSWVNLRIMTPGLMASADVLPELIAEDWVQMVRDVDLFLVDTLLPGVLKELKDDYFTRQAQGLARSFLRTLHALRASGVDTVDHSPDHIRHRLLSDLYGAYVAALESEKVYDDAMLYRRALKRNIQDRAHYAILDATHLPGFAFDYIRARTRNRLCRIGHGEMGVSLPEHCAGVRFADLSEPAPAGEIGPGLRLFTSGMTSEDRHRVRVRETLGVETEIRAILRDLKAENIPLDDVEIVYTVEKPYHSLLCDLVQRFDMPATFASGIPVNITRIGQALISFYRWMGSGYHTDEWVGLCRSGLVRFGDEGPTPDLVASVARQMRIGEGRSRYAEAMAAMKQRALNPDAEEVESFGALTMLSIEAVERLMAHVFSMIPEGASVTLQEVAGAGARFLDEFTEKSETPGVGQNWEDGARVALLAFLTQVQGTVKRTGNPRTFASRLTEMLGRRTFSAAPSKPGCVAITPLTLAGYSHRSHIYVVGMDEGSFPGGAIEDPLLLDGERAGLSGELALHRTRPSQQVWHLARVMAMATGRITLSSCRRSLADGRERYPAAVFQQAAQQMGITEMDGAILPALPEEIALALDETEALLAHHRSEGYAQFVHDAFPWMGAGALARRARAAAAFTRFDGWLGGETPELAISATRGVFSASRFEMLARCPYRYFLHAVLGIHAIEEPEEDPARWLDPMAFGSLLHRLFKDFMQQVKTRGERPHVDRHSVLIQSILAELIDEKRERHPVIHEAAYRADVRRLEQVAQVFLSVTAQEKEADPVGFEVSFGFGEEGHFSTADPVTITLEKDVSFKLRGRIDRVDRLGDGYVIWDYKTGSMSQYDEGDLLKRGTHLQWALYAYALEEVLKGREVTDRVMASGYLFPGDREHGKKLTGPPPASQHLAGVLRPLFELPARGGFFHVQKSSECTYCSYNRVCGREAVEGKRFLAIREEASYNPELGALMNSLDRWMSL